VLLNYDGFQNFDHFLDDDEGDDMNGNPDDATEPPRKRLPPRIIDFGEDGECLLAEESNFEEIPEEAGVELIGETDDI
jgi:hypothetical protein